jgi:hypothetical protein
LSYTALFNPRTSGALLIIRATNSSSHRPVRFITSAAPVVVVLAFVGVAARTLVEGGLAAAMLATGVLTAGSLVADTLATGTLAMGLLVVGLLAKGLVASRTLAAGMLADEGVLLALASKGD